MIFHTLSKQDFKKNKNLIISKIILKKFKSVNFILAIIKNI